MSDEEDIRDSEEEEEESREATPVRSSGPSEAQIAMQKRREQLESMGALDEATVELLEAARTEREHEAEEIRRLRQKRERRKKERAEEERRLAELRQQEDARRKQEEEERRKKKEAEEASRRAERAKKMAEFEKWKNPTGPNFVITKKSGGSISDEIAEPVSTAPKKSREQLEAEKRAIMVQRIPPLDIDGFDVAKFIDKAKELHNHIYKLESEKYDLEKRFKEQQYDMMELAESARKMNKVGRGGLKRQALGPDGSDKMQTKIAGAPAKVEMYSTFERQKDKRSYTDRRTLFKGPQYLYQAERIVPKRKVKWNEGGIPTYGAENQDAEETVQLQQEVEAEE